MEIRTSLLKILFKPVFLLVLLLAARAQAAGGPYDKPYIENGGKGTILGGYMDHELFWNDKKKTYGQGDGQANADSVISIWANSVPQGNDCKRIYQSGAEFGNETHNSDFNIAIGHCR